MRPERPPDSSSVLPSTVDVRDFWERNPVAAAAIEPRHGGVLRRLRGGLRQTVEPSAVQEEIYTSDSFAGKAVLEVGCGNGYLLSQYARRGARTCGSDLTWTACMCGHCRSVLCTACLEEGPSSTFLLGGRGGSSMSGQ